LCFRPNFVLEHHPGAASELMERCVKIASDCGLENVHWSGFPGLPGEAISVCHKMEAHYLHEGTRLAATYAREAGCATQPRNCGACPQNQNCALKSYRPRIVT
jgi:pyruvate formate lyase activating enzyme